MLLSLLLLFFPSSDYNYTVLNVAIIKSSAERITDAVIALKRAINIDGWHRWYGDYVNITSVRVSPLGKNAFLAFFLFSGHLFHRI